MVIKEKEVELLQEAFSQFNATSFELKKSYSLLKETVTRLKRELKESNLEKENLREEAERNHRLAVVGEMSARMAHELRNPLCSIEIFSSLLKKEVMHDPEKREWADHLSRAVRSMDYAITNFLLFTGKPTPKFQEVKLERVIESIRPFVAHRLQQNKIDWIVAVEPLPRTISCDEDLLRQVLTNLVINAIDAMPKGGKLKLSVKPAKNGWHGVAITVSDTGSGISKKTIPQIFDPFFTTKDKGTGLGLSIVQNAIAAHKGTIDVKSSSYGTTFVLKLPLRQDVN
ncbi:hypothetical protein JYT87_00345 [Nitrospira defluvii]|nr:hypothetical protein [Nitrospira defluvii]